MRLNGKRVLVFARDLPLRGDLLGSQAHAIGDAEVFAAIKDMHVHRRRIAHHRHHAHRFAAGGDHHLGLANADAIGGHGQRGQPGGAKAVDGDAAHRIGQAGQQGSDSPDIEALLAFRDGAADDRIFDGGRVERGHLCEGCAQCDDQQIVGADVAKGALGRFADRCARGGNDVGVLNGSAHGSCSGGGLGESLRVNAVDRQLRTGLPVCIIPMIRSWVLGCVSSPMKALRSSVISQCSSTIESASTSPPHITSAIVLPR